MNNVLFYGPQKSFARFCGPPNFFPSFMIRKLKKFGKHCTTQMQQEGSGGGGKLFFMGLLGMLDNLEIDYFCVLLNFYVTKFFQAFIAKSTLLPNFFYF
jgi:hypothetical protein